MGLCFACRNTIHHSENPDWSLNVLEVLLADIIKHNIEFIAYLPVSIIRDTNATRRRDGLETCG